MNNGPEHIKFEESTGPGSYTPDHDGKGDPQLEAILWQALRPQDPPAGFADRVMARALGDAALTELPITQTIAKPVATGKLLSWPQRHPWVTGAAAAALALGAFGGEVAVRHAREQQRRIVQATQQFQTTERITVHALAQAREQLQRAGVPLSLD